MGFDRTALAEDIRREGRVVRVVVADVAGSAPRETGASMTVWPGGQRGTIGGGALEWEAAARARAILPAGGDRIDRLPLGPALGQCCGGHVTLVSEVWDSVRLEAYSTTDVIARSLPGGSDAMPLSLRRRLAKARAQGADIATEICEGWLAEPVERPVRSVWIYGAGHVGRAIAAVLAALPGVEVTLIDDAEARFPNEIPHNVRPLVAQNPADAVGYAPEHAEHLVLTYSHALDLEICHRILGRGFRSAGLIGSETKWARFRARLASLGHANEQIARIICPIGNPALGKHPQAIAVGVGAAFLADGGITAKRRGEKTG